MRQQCGADASGAPSSCEPGAPRSQALVLELPRLSRGQAQRAEPVRSAWLALAQLRLVATPPNDSRRVRTKIVNSRSWGLRRSHGQDTNATQGSSGSFLLLAQLGVGVLLTLARLPRRDGNPLPTVIRFNA